MNRPNLTEAKYSINLDAPSELKVGEIRFAASMAVHSPILASDHIRPIIKINIYTNAKCNN